MPAENAASSQLRQLFDDEWEFRMQEDPLFATLCGDHRFDDRLPSVAEQDFTRRLARMYTFLDRARAIEPGTLTPEERLNHDIFMHMLENEIAETGFRAYLMPMSKTSGFHSSFAELPEFAPFDTPKDYENYIARLGAFMSYAEGHIELMRIGMRDDYQPPRAVLEGVADSLRAHVVEDAARSVFFRPFTQFPDAIDQAERKRLVEAGSAAIMNSIAPGYQALQQFVTDEYVPAAREDVAA